MKIAISIFLILIGIVNNSFAQYRVGIKGSLLASWERPENNEFRQGINNGITPGIQVGIPFTYLLGKEYAVHFEGTYANIGRYLKGGINDEFKNKARFHFIETPVLFRKYFRKEKYSYYLTAGGNFKYWIAGKGEIKSFEYDEAGLSSLNYKLDFNASSPLIDSNGNIGMPEVNRILVGLDFGLGFEFNTAQDRYLSLEIKYQSGHSWLGEDAGIDVGLVEYFEDFRSSINSLQINIMYQVARKIGQNKKGKSSGERVKVIKPKK